MTVHIAYLAEEQTGLAAGTRVVEPPANSHQAQRGNFYAVVELYGLASGGPQLAERVLSAMQRGYYNAKGTQSQVLSAAVRQAQQMIQAENMRTKSDWRAGVVCAGLLNDRIALAGFGSAFAFVTTDGGSVNVYPPDRLDSVTDRQNQPGGLWPIHRQRLDAFGVFLAGSGAWLEHVSARTMAAAAAYVTPETIQDAADGLREQAGRSDLLGFLVVVGDAKLPPPPPPDGGGQAPKPKPGNGLPTAVNASPPVTSAPPPAPAEPADSGDDTGETSGDSISEEDASTADDEDETHSNATTGFGVDGDRTDLEPTEDESVDEPLNAETTRGPKLTSSLVVGAKAGYVRARELVGNMLPDRASAEYGPSTELAGEAVTVMEAAMPAAAMAVPSRGLVTPSTVSEPYSPPQPATGGRARIFVAIAVLILILVPSIMAAMYWQQGVNTQSQAEALLDLGEARLQSAKGALDQGDDDNARALLTEARGFILEAEDSLGRTQRSAQLMSEIDTEYQQVMKAALLYGLTAPLATFPPEAEPNRLWIAGQDIYVMDSGRGEMIQFRMDASGETLSDANGQVVLREGDVIDGISVGRIVDIGWQTPIPGYEDKSNLLVLDNNNRVFRYNEQVDGATLLDFGSESGWQQANQLEVYLDRLYVLDEEANQIYRYAPGQYASPPVPWFPETTQVNLRGVRSMRIDGDIWLLYDDGKVVRYHAGEQVPFGLDDSVALPTQAVDLFVTNAADGAVYVADAAEERLLMFSKEDGSYLGQLQPAEGRPLRGLRGLFIDEARESLFLLTDEAFYNQPLPN